MAPRYFPPIVGVTTTASAAAQIIPPTTIAPRSTFPCPVPSPRRTRRPLAAGQVLSWHRPNDDVAWPDELSVSLRPVSADTPGLMLRCIRIYVLNSTGARTTGLFPQTRKICRPSLLLSPQERPALFCPRYTLCTKTASVKSKCYSFFGFSQLLLSLCQPTEHHQMNAM